MRNKRWAALLLGGLLALTARAQEVHPDGQSFERRRWSQADGAPQFAMTVTQTDDGMLWFAGPSGLHSFDGLRFRRVDKVYGHALSSSNISIARKVQGGLAVGYYFGGLSIFMPGSVTHYVPGRDFPRGSVMDIAVGKDGVMHCATSSGLAVLRDGKWQPEGQSSLPQGRANWVKIDQSGRLWAFIGKDYFVRPIGREDFVPVPVPPDSRTTIRTDGLYAKPAGKDIQRLDIVATPPPERLDHPELYKNVPIKGPHGTQWAYRGDGLVRLAPGEDGVLRAVELFASGSGREEVISRSTIDREDNLWLLTPSGVERLRRHRFHRLDTQLNTFFWLAQRGLGDELWFGAINTPLLRRKPDGTTEATEIRNFNALLRTAADHVWVGGNALWEFHGGTQRRWALPAQAGKEGEIQALAAEADGGLLVSIVRNGLWRFAHGQWQQDERLRGVVDPVPVAMLTDARGKTWLGFAGGRLVELAAGQAHPLPASAGLQVGNVLCLLDIGGKLLVGGDLGAAWIDGGQAHALRPEHAERFQHVSGMVLDGQGSLWVHSNDGLHRFDAAALAQFWKTPALPLQAELFNFEDGVGGVAAGGRPLPSLAQVGGRLYYATVSQVGWIDPAGISRNLRPPNVLLQTLRTPEKDYAPVDQLVLPQQTSAIELAFTATALSIPERVRMQFRLSGVDRDWRDAGLERRAQYTNLAPGHYRFQVRAANEDGAWNHDGAQLTFAIPPAFWQTDWFRTLGALAALALSVLLYRWRVAVIEQRAAHHAILRLDATLQERSRIARSLHDNLLQAVQALLLRFHLVEQKLAQQPELQQMVGSALDYAETLVASTRDEVMALRRPQDADELFAALRHAAAQAGAGAGAEQRLSFTVSGQPRYLRADCCAELSSVLREAVLNSVLHSGARQIAVRLTFEDDALLAEASDDGAGMDGAIARHGKPGHWGIPGMRERIVRLGGQFDIAAGAQGGVAVRLSIPARQAYA
ncbi:sensor histidine kinase [Pseudoduganella violaceinigra]|uniref:sensor histidine kinase n=1 Tax=Pseudoduganella violaceinigra TaxID=246602 RepID=UPI000406670A|nr:sensor histidine kinase [Pseudoduganella violaceinigra]